jgi:DNA (cytosine-5)-methyltransferase 1
MTNQGNESAQACNQGDAGLHSVSGAPLETADWVIASWQKAVREREVAGPARERCPVCGRPKALDVFSGEGGAGKGYMNAGFCVDAVDMSAARLARYPRECSAAKVVQGDAIAYILDHGHKYALKHASPTCTGYSRGTAAIPDRLEKYDRLIGATREALLMVGGPYVIENVADARPELRDPLLLCGRMFGLSAIDDDGTPLVMDRHRLFECSEFVMVPDHPKHDRRVQVAGSYGGARRDKVEARTIRKGGYVPSADVQRALLGTPWMSEKGCQLSIPPVYTEYIGRQILERIEAAA